jgi:molybdopterin converting factor small subunit
VTQLPIHTPYDGTSKLFQIGLKPLDLKNWIEIDGTFDFQLAEKRRIFAEYHDKVFVAERGTENAQAEVLALLTEHLPARFPERYQRDGERLTVVGHPQLDGLDTRDLPPLHKASLLIQEDLILMRRGEEGWRLAAGSLCFPSSWLLTEKFGKPMSGIHEPVPGFGPGTRNAGLIDRMFDKLQIMQPVERFNWSIQVGDALYHPLSNAGRIDRATGRPMRFPDVEAAARAFIRVERQTLRKLPISGDILFTIRIYLDPMGLLKRRPDRVVLAASFAGQLLALDSEQLDYKGLTADRDRLVEALRGIAEG